MTVNWSAWRDTAAVWGAVLSTFLFLERLLPSRPLIRLEPGPYQGQSDPGLTIRIVNPSSDMVLVGYARRFPIRGQSTDLGIYTRHSSIADAGKNPSPIVLYVPGADDASLLLTFVAAGTWVLLIWWRRTWLLPIWLLRPIFVSSGMAAKINSGAKAAAEKR